MRRETDWYRCTTRDNMVKLVNAGFDYKNCRPEKWNDNNTTYFFERTEELEKYVEDHIY